MIATIVNASANAVQVFALIAVIVFVIAGVMALLAKSFYSALICAGLVFLSLAVLFLT